MPWLIVPLNLQLFKPGIFHAMQSNPMEWLAQDRTVSEITETRPWGPSPAPWIPLPQDFDCCGCQCSLAIWRLDHCGGPDPFISPQQVIDVLWENEKKAKERLVQDGEVEGRALTPSCESTRITANCWTIIDRKTLELTKRDTPHPKTKEKPQWNSRRGAITIKSNPITAGWVAHKLESIHWSEVHPLEWRFWAPRKASQPGGPAMGGGIPRESDFEG